MLLFLQYGRTPLHTACANGHSKVAETLYQYGANIQAVDKVKT